MSDNELIKSAEHWERIATEAEELSQWNRMHGIDLSPAGASVGDHRAAVYRRTAAAIRLEAETGRPHCSTCLRDHPNHLHMHQG